MNLHQKSPELLPPAAADCATGVRLIKIHKEEKTRITNRSARSTYPKKKSVLTSEATPGSPHRNQIASMFVALQPFYAYPGRTLSCSHCASAQTCPTTRSRQLSAPPHQLRQPQ